MFFKNLLNALFIAFSMYSKIPVPRVDWNEKSMKYAFCFFPLIGAVIGIIVYLIGKTLITYNCGKLLFACIMSIIPIFITGGIHFDGFLDTADGINSYADTEKRLEILKDPNSGAFAIIWGISYFVLSIGFWSEANIPALEMISFGYVISRAFSAFSVVVFPMAKKTGLAVMFNKNADKIAVRITMISFIVIVEIIAVYVNLFGGVALLLTAIICFLYHYFNCKKNFGGITGDLAGFFLQVCELAIIIVEVILFLVVI